MQKNTSHFFDSLKAINKEHEDFIAEQSNDDLAWVSVNRDFGETERYRVKEDVDESLLNSTVITSERQKIENIFTNGNDKQQVANYINRLDSVLGRLHDFLEKSSREVSMWDLKDHILFWQEFSILADKDNAHAMYLSSGNWTFSVFDNLICHFKRWSVEKPELFFSLLTAGKQDIRTSIQREFANHYLGLNRNEYVEKIRTSCDWVRPTGVVTLVCYSASTGAFGSLQKENIAEELSDRFNYAVNQVVKIGNNESTRDIIKLYQSLYTIRYQYDVYEYFGMYAFLRNFLIMHLYKAAQSVSKEFAQKVLILASTYQYEKTAKMLKENIK